MVSVNVYSVCSVCDKTTTINMCTVYICFCQCVGVASFILKVFTFYLKSTTIY